MMKKILKVILLSGLAAGVGIAEAASYSLPFTVVIKNTFAQPITVTTTAGSHASFTPAGATINQESAAQFSGNFTDNSAASASVNIGITIPGVGGCNIQVAPLPGELTGVGVLQSIPPKQKSPPFCQINGGSYVTPQPRLQVFGSNPLSPPTVQIDVINPSA